MVLVSIVSFKGWSIRVNHVSSMSFYANMNGTCSNFFSWLKTIAENRNMK